MRFAFFALVITLFTLPLVAKAYDNTVLPVVAAQSSDADVNAAAADMLAVIDDMNEAVKFEPASADVTAMAQALNALDVGTVQR